MRNLKIMAMPEGKRFEPADKNDTIRYYADYDQCLRAVKSGKDYYSADYYPKGRVTFDGRRGGRQKLADVVGRYENKKFNGKKAGHKDEYFSGNVGAKPKKPISDGQRYRGSRTNPVRPIAPKRFGSRVFALLKLPFIGVLLCYDY